MFLTWRREPGAAAAAAAATAAATSATAAAAATRGYRRKLQTRLKLSRSYSWNYEPGLVVFYFVTDQLFGCEFG